MKTAHVPWLAKQGYVDDNGLRHDAELLPSERQRLVGLVKQLNPARVFTVERNVIVSTPGEERHGGQRRFALVPFTVWANNAIEAGVLGNDMKYQRELALGHHHG